MTENNKTVTALSVREAAALADGKGKIAVGTFDRIKVTSGQVFLVEGLMAFAVVNRGVTGFADGPASLTAMAAATLTHPEQEVPARQSALSKLVSAVKRVKAAGLPMTSEVFEPIRIAGDTSKDGRAILDAAIAKAAETDDKSVALTDVLTACDKARASKAAARTAAAKAKADAAAKAAADAKSEPGQTDSAGDTVSLSWAQTLAILASNAPAKAAELDADSLDLALKFAASIVDALTDARATVQTALASVKAKRK
jgi:hypothetical protein